MAGEQISLTAGMRSNLLSLQNSAKLIDRTAFRLSTGMKVNSALDDPINYFSAKSHNDRANDLAFRKDEMSEAIQTIKGADAGIEAITNLIASAKSLAQSALSATTTTESQTLLTQYGSVLSQIDELANDSGYKGVNFLRSSTLAVNFSETAGDAVLTITGFNGTTSGLSISASTTWFSAGAVSTTLINSDITELDTARDTLRTESEKLSNNLSIINTRESFTDNMINVLKEGADKLTLADLDEEGASMLMLQTRQALGQTALSITSQAAQGVLRLF